MIWKAASAILLTVILGVTVGKQEKDFSILLTLAVCAMVSAAFFSYIEPVLDFLRELNDLAEIQGDILEILIKAVCVAFLSEITGMLCSDAGNSAMAKVMQLLASGAIVHLSIPLFQLLLKLTQEILGGL